MISILFVKAAIALRRGPRYFHSVRLARGPPFLDQFWVNVGSGDASDLPIEQALKTKEAAFPRLEITVYHGVN